VERGTLSWPLSKPRGEKAGFFTFHVTFLKLCCPVTVFCRSSRPQGDFFPWSVVFFVLFVLSLRVLLAKNDPETVTSPSASFATSRGSPLPCGRSSEAVNICLRVEFPRWEGGIFSWAWDAGPLLVFRFFRYRVGPSSHWKRLPPHPR